MKIRKWVGLLLVVMAFSTGQGFSQNAPQFTSVVQTPEHSIQLTWTSTNSELYRIQYANALATNSDGSTAWQTLYDQYPSQGTNTLWLDTGNYILSPQALNPRFTFSRFYRIVDEGPDSLPSDEPAVFISSPTNGFVASGEMSITVNSYDGSAGALRNKALC